MTRDDLDRFVATVQQLTPRPGWVVIPAAHGRRESLVCLTCGFESFHPRDVAERYCGRCHRFLDDDPPPPAA